jgi:RND family efflux transporter MFP subunit
MKRSGSLLLVPFLLAAAACGASSADKAGGKETAAAEAAAETPADTAPPALPEDVRDLAAVAHPKAEASGASESGETLAGTVSATGELVAPVTSEVAVRMPGRVGQVYADEGERVRKGQPLLTLETQYLSLDLKRAEAEVARAAASEAEAERDFGRKEELIAKGSVAQAAYDRSQSGYAAAQAAVAAAEAARDLARQRLEDAVLRSPISGVVAERRADVGERLGDSSVAFVVVQTSPLKLRFQLPERYLARVRRGQEVRAKVDPYPGATFTGTVSVVGGVVDPATRTVAVEIELANADGRLSPGLFARVELDLGPVAEG